MLTKACSTCKEEKELISENYSYKNKEKGIFSNQCKPCFTIYRNKHYEDNKEKYFAKAKKHDKLYKERNELFIFEYLKENPCAECGEKDPLVLEFDHLEEKNNDISSLLKNGSSLETIKKELVLCQVLCANCHRRKTYKQLNWYRYQISTREEFAPVPE